MILNLIAFIHHDVYFQIKQNGTHQSMTFRNIQAFLDMLQHSHNFHILILFLKICDKENNNLFGSVLLLKRFVYTSKTHFSMPR